MADGIAQEAVEFLHHVQEVESTNRAEALQDLKFRYGDQWPASMIDARGSRPKLTVNETDAYCRKMENTIREQRPRARAYPMSTRAQKKTAEVITGLLRHYQVNSDADNSYDQAASHAITIGWGYWRITPRFVREDSFDQDVYIDPVDNPFSVYNDTNSVLPDGSDSEKCLITDQMRLDQYKREFPGADTAGFVATTTGDVTSDWLTKDTIRIAEYFRVEREKAKLVQLSNGVAVWEDEIEAKKQILDAAGLTVKGARDSYKRKVMWRKVSAFQELQVREFPSRWIPVVPTYGMVVVIDGKRVRLGAVRFARDPQKMVNYWQSAVTETLAMAPKAKWLLVEGQDEGYENEWRAANIDAQPVLRYRAVDIEGKPAPAPQRIAPEPPPEGLVMATMQASENLKRVIGIFDPETNVRGPKSGRAINAEAQQTERTNFHFYDNLTRSIKHSSRIAIDITSRIMDVPRVVCVIGDDGKTDLVSVNQTKEDAEAANEVLHDLRVREYGVVMETGPGYDSKRQEGAEIIGNVLAKDPALMQMIGDLWFRYQDFPGSEIIADRLAAANPLAQIDEKSDVPPQAQMMIKSLQDKLQKAMQALQQAGLTIKYRQDVEEVRQQHEDKRELMRVTTKAHDVEMTTQTKREDTATRAVTAQNVAEISGLVQLLLKHVDTGQLRMEIEQRDREQQAQAAQAEREAQATEAAPA